MARDIIQTFSKRHYFSSEYSFPMINHALGVAIESISLHLSPFQNGGGNIFTTYKNHKNNRFDRDTKLIFQSIRNITKCSRTLWTPCIKKQLDFTNSLFLRLLNLLYILCRVLSLPTKFWRLKLQITLSTVS